MLKGFLYAISILLCIDVHAQLMPFKNYRIKDGQSSNSVQAIVRDDRGLLWIGTDFCVYWYDGKRFYQPSIATNIGQLYIHSFYKDWNDDIWVLTFFNGLYKYKNGQFINYLFDTVSKNAIINTVLGMVQVTANKYVISGQGGTFLFDGQRFTQIDATNEVLKKSGSSVAVLPDSTLVIV